MTFPNLHQTPAERDAFPAGAFRPEYARLLTVYQIIGRMPLSAARIEARAELRQFFQEQRVTP